MWWLNALGIRSVHQLTQAGAKVQVMDGRDTMPCAMLMWAKELRVTLHGDLVV